MVKESGEGRSKEVEKIELDKMRRLAEALGVNETTIAKEAREKMEMVGKFDREFADIWRDELQRVADGLGDELRPKFSIGIMIAQARLEFLVDEREAAMNDLDDALDYAQNIGYEKISDAIKLILPKR